MSTETQLWTFLTPRMLPYGRIVRVENGATVAGTPDIYFNLRPKTGWIEGKHLDALPIKASTPIVIPTLTIDQVNWLNDEWNAGGLAFLLLRAGRTLLLFDPAAAEDIFYRKLALVGATAKARFVSSVSSFKPAEFFRCLSR